MVVTVILVMMWGIHTEGFRGVDGILMLGKSYSTIRWPIKGRCYVNACSSLQGKCSVHHTVHMEGVYRGVESEGGQKRECYTDRLCTSIEVRKTVQGT